MSTTRRDDLANLLRLALDGLDAQIADLQVKRGQLAAMIGGQSGSTAMKAAAPQKRRKLSGEGRAKISAAAKARWAKERKAKTKAAQPKPATRKAQSRAKPMKSRPAPAKAKKSPAKKGRPKPAAPSAKAGAVKSTA